MTLPNPYPAARYRFDFVAETPIRLPEYAGSTLRGAFGGALRRIACMTRGSDCKACPLYRSCPYPAIFEPPPPAEHALQKFSQVPAPFIIEPPAWGERSYAAGETLTFHLVLIGRAQAQLSLIVYAMQQALQRGVGKGEGSARMARVCLADDEDACIYTPEDGQIRAHRFGIVLAGEGEAPDQVELHLQTPLRLQHNGKPVRPGQLTGRDFLVHLLRRVALVTEFHAGQPLGIDFTALAAQAESVEVDGALEWRDWTRYSSRQRQEMTLGGCVGRWLLRGQLASFLPYLYLGQWLHCGKNASFGLGRYTLVTRQVSFAEKDETANPISNHMIRKENSVVAV